MENGKKNINRIDFNHQMDIDTYILIKKLLFIEELPVIQIRNFLKVNYNTVVTEKFINQIYNKTFRINRKIQAALTSGVVKDISLSEKEIELLPPPVAIQENIDSQFEKIIEDKINRNEYLQKLVDSELLNRLDDHGQRKFMRVHELVEIKDSAMKNNYSSSHRPIDPFSNLNPTQIIQIANLNINPKSNERAVVSEQPE